MFTPPTPEEMSQAERKLRLQELERIEFDRKRIALEQDYHHEIEEAYRRSYTNFGHQRPVEQEAYLKVELLDINTQRSLRLLEENLKALDEAEAEIRAELDKSTTTPEVQV